jgi:hypothetical protein
VTTPHTDTLGDTPSLEGAGKNDPGAVVFLSTRADAGKRQPREGMGRGIVERAVVA